MEIKPVFKKDLKNYKHLMIPYIYDEYRGNEDKTELGYWGFALVLSEDEDGYERALASGKDEAAASVLVIQPESGGDLNIVSVFTYPPFRRRGYASKLLRQALVVARTLFKWDEGESEDDIMFKTLYRLPEDLRTVYESFLIKNMFSDFVLVDEEKEVWSASAMIRMLREDKK
jgi:GNAT superfamily N-acetyltransferase